MRLAIITDIHEDIISLREALRKIDRFRCDEIVCLGDISGFSLPYYNYFPTRNAHECLSLIRSVCSVVLLGNHDIHAASIIPEHCSFFEFPDNWYQLDYHQRHELGNDTLWLHEENDLNPLYKGDDLEYLRSLSEFHVLQLPERNILFTHYVYPNISGLKKEFYTYGDEFDQHLNFMAKMNCTVSFTGHVHIRGFFTANGGKFKQHRYKELTLNDNPVCVGLPPITRLNNRSGFCIFDTDSNSMKVIKI